jgi:small neutral amino acid transporter SnatA (MarC family)
MDVLEQGILLLALLNPFLLVVYLVDIMKTLDRSQFRMVLLRAGIISVIVFCLFALVGNAIFSEVIQAEFASFQIFGGLILALIGLQFVFRGPYAIEILRGESEHISGAIAMPVLIGPGTLSACIIIGNRQEPLFACATILGAVSVSLILVVLLKVIHDYVRPRREALVERYIDIAGRITALYVGTVAVEMIMSGITTWGKGL